METQNTDDQNSEQAVGPESQNQYEDQDRDDLTYGIDPDKRAEQKPLDENNYNDQNNDPLPGEVNESEDDDFDDDNQNDLAGNASDDDDEDDESLSPDRPITQQEEIDDLELLDDEDDEDNLEDL